NQLIFLIHFFQDFLKRIKEKRAAQQPPFINVNPQTHKQYRTYCITNVKLILVSAKFFGNIFCIYLKEFQKNDDRALGSGKFYLFVLKSSINPSKSQLANAWRLLGMMNLCWSRRWLMFPSSIYMATG